VRAPGQLRCSSGSPVASSLFFFVSQRPVCCLSIRRRYVIRLTLLQSNFAHAAAILPYHTTTTPILLHVVMFVYTILRSLRTPGMSHILGRAVKSVLLVHTCQHPCPRTLLAQVILDFALLPVVRVPNCWYQLFTLYSY
jgi:hypothetical protein